MQMEAASTVLSKAVLIVERLDIKTRHFCHNKTKPKVLFGQQQPTTTKSGEKEKKKK